MIGLRKFNCRAAVFAMAVALGATGAYAQSPEDAKHAVPPQAPSSTPDTVEDTAKAGPVIYVTDSDGQLATVTLGTYAVHIIGKEGVVLTDLGFNPKDGQLYGVSFTSFYWVNRTTGKVTFIGKLGISEANALVFNGQGVAYTAAVDSSERYTINIKTGHVSSVGSMKPFKSAGDLTFYNSGLGLSGYYQSSLGSDTPDTLALLNPKTGKAEAYAELKIANLFGIACTSKDTLYGFAGKGVYQLFPSETEISKRAVLLKDLTTKGLGDIYGAAFDDYFLY
jgi:hypothetical protein